MRKSLMKFVDVVFMQLGTMVYCVAIFLVTIKLGLWFAGVLGLI